MNSAFDRIAEELYGLAPSEFTARRDGEAADARRRGDRELAVAIKALKRPTSSAWLVNQLVRQRREPVDELLELGEALRQAQDELAGSDLRRLSQQRRQVVGALVAAAKGLAAAIGQKVSEEATREVESTLEAALADPAAGEAVRSGRLTTALSSSGLGSLGLEAAASAPARTQPTPPPAASPTRPRAAGAGREAARSLRLEAAEQVLREAVAEAASTAEEAARAEQRATATRDGHRRLRRAISELETHLAELQADETQATQQLRVDERSAEDAGRSAKAAERRAEQARRTLERLKD
ncbi:MAG: hypothetical protein ABSH30_04010 [Acidimicrobiales bacterium]|jgi:hypothetical protein